MGDKKSRPAYSTTPAAASSPHEKMTTSMVGFDDQLVNLLDKLAGGEPNRQIVLVDGMGGIGKTTLARSAFENQFIMQHFDTRSWVTVSQTYSVKGILFDLLSNKKEQECNEMDPKEEKARLGERLHKMLFGRRYLVILDDMWSVDAWDRIRCYLPDNNNGSRVVITTRESHMSTYFGCSRLPMRLLNEDQSWELFREYVFAQKSCPPEYEKIGKEIAGSCKRLPLSISVIGGLLRKSSMTLENWKDIAKDINSYLINPGEDEQCSNILSLSYDYLYAHLKPCFLYMGVFPEDHEIRVSRLIRLWIAEGFIKPNKSQSLKAIARGYLHDLIDRNLIIPIYQAYYGKSKRIKMHDLVRELCLATAKKDNFLHVTEVVDVDSEHQRRIVIHQTIGRKAYEQKGGKLAIPLARSLILDKSYFPFKCKLLRVLSAQYNKKGSAKAILDNHLNLRYLAFDRCRIRNLPRSIFRLWNLQTLIVRDSDGTIITAPVEIWRMPQLRHIDFYRISLPIPPPGNQRDDDRVVLQNLQTLRDVSDFIMSEDVRQRIPNVKKLHLTVTRLESQKEINFEGLDELQTLQLRFHGEVPKWGTDTCSVRQPYNWPVSLKKLTLWDCKLGWEDLSSIGSLPLLQHLLLRGGVSGAEWRPNDGEFLSLKFLRIEDIADLIRWNAESSHFPKLETLFLADAVGLEEIPLDVGNIPTLKRIRLDGCSVSSAISGMKIVQEQEEDYGNYDIHIRIKFWDEEKRKMFREAVEEEGLSSDRFIYR